MVSDLWKYGPFVNKILLTKSAKKQNKKHESVNNL